MEAVEKTRVLLARLINAPKKEQVIFTLNCTDALNLAIKGLLRQGDHVIMSSMEHNSVVRPLTKLASLGVKISQVFPSKETGVLSAQDIEGAITKDTKLVAVTHASNVTGIIQPIEEYGAIVRKHGLIFMVDAAQTAGKFPIDVHAGNIDLLAFSGHKGLFGPPGTGVLYVGDRVDLDTLREGGTGSQSELEDQPSALPDRYESGTLNSIGIGGLGAGLEYIFTQGLDKIHAHEQRLTETLIQGLLHIPGVTLYVAKDRNKQVPVVSLNMEGYDPGEVGVILDQTFDIKARTGLHCSAAAHKTLGTFPSGTIRLSPGYFNTVEEMEATLHAFERIARTGTPATSGSSKKQRGRRQRNRNL
jgi:cysteine desulfurase family protein